MTVSCGSFSSDGCIEKVSLQALCGPGLPGRYIRPGRLTYQLQSVPSKGTGMNNVVVILWSIVLAIPSSINADSHIEWTYPGRCGTNCLFVFLSLVQMRPDYNRLASSLPIQGERGTSLQDLADVAKASGVNVAVRRVPADQLVDVEPPFIMHLELADRGGSGHFITVYAIDRNRDGADFLYVDGGNGTATRSSYSTLRPLATGFVLMLADQPAPSSQSLLSLTLYSAIGACAFVVILAFYTHRKL